MVFEDYGGFVLGTWTTREEAEKAWNSLALSSQRDYYLVQILDERGGL